MIASPSDVSKERRLAVEVIHRWNTMHAHEKQTVLMPLTWETSSAPVLGDRAQAIINKQVLVHADILIGVFWTRLGTPTGSSESGTAEEIEEHVEAGKPALLYFSDAPVRPDSIDEQQYARLRDFRGRLKEKGLIETYESEPEFIEKLHRHLVKTVNSDQYVAGTSSLRAESSGGDSTSRNAKVTKQGIPDLSKDAQVMIVEAAQSGDGMVLVIQANIGLVVQTNGRGFVPENDPRESARWAGVVQELVSEGLLHDEGFKGEYFVVTTRGYEVADLLRGRI